MADEEEMVRIHVMDAHISGGIDKWAASSNGSNNIDICILFPWYCLLIAVASFLPAKT